MPASHQIEWVAYDPGSFDEFKEALQAMGLSVTQQENIIDGVTYTHFAKLANAPFNNGIYFKYTPERTEVIQEQEIHYNSRINYQISKGINNNSGYEVHAIGYIDGRQQHSEYDTFVYKIPYIRTDDNGVIILGLGYFEVTNSTTGYTNITQGNFVFFLPPYEHDEFCEFGYFGYPAGAVSSERFYDVAYSGSNAISVLYRELNLPALARLTGDVFIIFPAYSDDSFNKYINKFNMISNRVFYLLYYENELSDTTLGAIFKDSDNKEYFITKRYGIAIKL